MQNKSKLRLSAVAALALGAVVFGVAAPANADPATGDFPALVGVGSDTTEHVVNGLGTVIDAVGSYNATGSAQIQTRSGGATFNRPNGSTGGVQALSASINATGTAVYPATTGVDITDQVDFARSSSSPSSSFPGSQLTFIPFARDAVSFAVNAASDFPREIALGQAADDTISPAPFTLRNIYRGVVTTYADSNFNDVTIRPLIPQSGSGTRSFWLSALGLTEGDVTGKVVQQVDRGAGLETVQEHDGTYVVGKGDIVPFSVAQYIAQANHSALPTAVNERRGTIELGTVGTTKPYAPATSGIGVVINPAFESKLTRLVFNVVETARLTGTSAEDILLQETFKGSTSDVCEATAIIEAYGFGTIGSECGSTTRTQGFRY